MKQAQLLVFDEYVAVPVGGSITATTNQDLNARLGMYDQLALQAVVDNATGSPTLFKVQIWHSADGRVWMPKLGTVASPGLAEIGGLPTISPPAGQSTYFGYDAGTVPSLAFVQLVVSLSTASAAAHVRVYVTSRDWGGR